MVLATTLVVAAITPSGDPDARDQADGENCHDPEQGTFQLQVAAVGDSPAFILAEGSFELLVGAAGRGDGLVSGSVQALPLRARIFYAKTCTLSAGSVLLMCTDGPRCRWPMAMAKWDGRWSASWRTLLTSWTSHAYSTSAAAPTATTAR